jgi:hypothetical protein
MRAPRVLFLGLGLVLSSCSDVYSTGAGAGAAGPPGLDLSASANEPVTRSYEVAIATAAADQVRGLEECATRPKAALADCRKQVNDVYEHARSAALVIRGTDR